MLTKSDYIKYIQCKKYLWLNKFKKEILPEELDDNLKRLFESGYKIEDIAYKLYPNAVNAEAEEKNIKEMILKTKHLMKEKAPIIFQATISGKNLFARADIIRYNKEMGAWDIIEVKSATEIKDIYIDDLSFQKICFEKAGVKVGKIFLMHVNNQYIKDGEIDPQEFFIINEITEAVNENLEETNIQIKNALEILKIKEEPDVQILRQCKKPYTCPFIFYCWKDFPDHSIYSIGSSLINEKNLKTLLDAGIIEIKDIPSELLKKEKLIKHHHAVKHDLVHIEKENIKEELSEIKYPIYYLDYETYAPAIPIIDAYRPYQRVVFQYSLHVQESPNSELKHYYFLANDLPDPTIALSKTLAERIGKTGSVIAWNMGFEKGCNTEMGRRAPEYQEFYEDINNRTVDLMIVFKKGFYVHKEFRGSASLKKVLPVLVPELSYNDLDIGEGMLASNTWGDMVTKNISQEEKDEIYNNLLAYCELDTLAMVKILEKLNIIINK